LNLNNILLNEKDNICVIDFSETRPRNIACDFARLEPLLSIQMTRLNKADDLACLLEFLGLPTRAPPICPALWDEQEFLNLKTIAKLR
jgi:hypothetical protein